MPTSGSGISRNGALWRTIAVTALSVVATGIGAWLVLARDTVARDDVERMIQDRSPFGKERGEIRNRIRRNEETGNRLMRKIEAIQSDVADIKAIVRFLAQGSSAPAPPGRAP